MPRSGSSLTTVALAILLTICLGGCASLLGDDSPDYLNQPLEYHEISSTVTPRASSTAPGYRVELVVRPGNEDGTDTEVAPRPLAILGRAKHGLTAKLGLTEAADGSLTLSFETEVSRLERPVETVKLAVDEWYGPGFFCHVPGIHRASVHLAGAPLPREGGCLRETMLVGSDTVEAWCCVRRIGS